MRSHEVPDEIDNLIDWATDDVYQGQDSPSWSPFNQGVQRMTVWAIEQAQPHSTRIRQIRKAQGGSVVVAKVPCDAGCTKRGGNMQIPDNQAK